MKYSLVLFIFFCSFNSYASSEISGLCDISQGKADSNVLALSSQAGFCETYGYEAGKPECWKFTSNSYQANHLTLHGLWPNQNACKQNYGFCGVRPRPNHCDYDELNLSSSVSSQLKQLMPSYNYGSCLERHEWNKHGSCQFLDTDGYFSLGMRLTKEVDKTIFGKFLTSHKGETVRLSQLRHSLDQSFGAENAGKIRLGCKDGILVDVFIILPALISPEQSIETLVNNAPSNRYKDACYSKVILSDFKGSIEFNPIDP